MTHRAILAAGLGASLLAAAALSILVMSSATQSEVDALREAVGREAAAHPPAWPEASGVGALPPPVRRWVAYTFPSGPVVCVRADVAMQGRFRRPRTESFSDTTARQRIAGGVPALVFDAITPVAGPVWARAFDGYVGGHMVMKARLLSAVTVVDEQSTPALDRSSLRRWLLEAAVCPTALLPGGPVTWEAVDDDHARARVRHGGLQASLLGTFDAGGRLRQFDAEEDGDLGLPYHGSGERVTRDDEREVQGMLVPHRFVVSRVAGGRALPFWEGRIVSLSVVTDHPAGVRASRASSP